MIVVQNNFNRPRLINIKEKQSIRLCKMYHKCKEPKTKDKCLKLCIKKSIEYEKLEAEEKSF